MRVPNRDGTPIDPVPFLVVALLAATVCITWGPVYMLELDIDLVLAVAVSSALAAVSIAVAYYWLIWLANPIVQEEVPVHVRFRKFLYAIVVGVIVVLALVAYQHV